MKPTKSKRAATLLMAVILFVTAIALPANAAVSDVKPGNWAYNAVQYNVENNLIAIDYSTYNMNAPAPRQDVAYAMFKLTNGKDVEPTKSVYTQYIPQDMKNSPDKYKYSVQWALQNRIIAGTKANDEKFTSANYQLWFSPTSIITREQMATLLYRLAEYDGLDTWAIYNIIYSYDKGKNTSTWARDGMEWAVTHNLMSGTGNNKLSPKGTLTYVQLAQLMMNYAKFKSESTETPDVTPEPTPDVTPKPTPDVTGKRSGNYYNQVAYPDDADSSDWLIVDSDYIITDLSGPWDNCKPVTDIPNGGYRKNGHRYNKYGVCIDDVDGLPTDEEKKAIIAINQHRINNSVEPVIWDQGAQVFAETRAIEMSYRYKNFNQYDHVRPDGSTGDEVVVIAREWSMIGILQKTHTSWINEAADLCGGRPQIYEGVNIYNGKAVTNSWINSPGHNRQLLDSNAHYGAVAYDGTDGCHMWVYNGLHTK